MSNDFSTFSAMSQFNLIPYLSLLPIINTSYRSISCLWRGVVCFCLSLWGTKNKSPSISLVWVGQPKTFKALCKSGTQSFSGLQTPIARYICKSPYHVSFSKLSARKNISSLISSSGVSNILRYSVSKSYKAAPPIAPFQIFSWAVSSVTDRG